ncbi:MAG: hypothetical protein ABIF45_24125 [Pseudomonadota bacterium]
MPDNLLCYGDNAVFLRDRDIFPDESVDLIYLDPPCVFDFRATRGMMLGKT